MAALPIPCPHCGEDISAKDHLTHVGWVPAERDPEGKARVDLILNCGWCDTDFNFFAPLGDFEQVYG